MRGRIAACSERLPSLRKPLLSRHSRRSRRWLAAVAVCLDGKKLVGAVVKTGNTAGILSRQ